MGKLADSLLVTRIATPAPLGATSPGLSIAFTAGRNAFSLELTTLTPCFVSVTVTACYRNRLCSSGVSTNAHELRIALQPGPLVMRCLQLVQLGDNAAPLRLVGNMLLPLCA